MFSKGFVREDASRANFNQISAEFVFKCSVSAPTKIDSVMRPENIKIPSAAIVSVKSDTSVTLNAAVHLVVDEWS
jgi:hypothetical protein